MMFDMSIYFVHKHDHRFKKSPVSGTWKEKTYADDMLCARFRCEHTQDTRAAAHVEHRFPPEQVRVVDNGRAVRARAHLVLEHFLMNTCMRPELSAHLFRRNVGEVGSPKCAYESA